MMIHSVYFWLTEEAKAKSKQFEESLKELIRIDCIDRSLIGVPAPTEKRPVTDHSFDYSLILGFNTKEAHDAYQDHPEHHFFIENCRAMWDRVLVYDSEAIA